MYFGWWSRDIYPNRKVKEITKRDEGKSHSEISNMINIVNIE